MLSPTVRESDLALVFTSVNAGLKLMSLSGNAKYWATTHVIIPTRNADVMIETKKPRISKPTETEVVIADSSKNPNPTANPKPALMRLKINKGKKVRIVSCKNFGRLWL